MGPALTKLRGAGGLRNPELCPDRALEATAFSIASGGGVGLTEIGRYYDCSNECVILDIAHEFVLFGRRKIAL